MPKVVIVKNDLPRLIAALRAGGPAAEAATAREIQARARAAAPVKTGRLKASISVRRGEVETTIEYARYQEFGTRKMPPHRFFYRAAEGALPRFVARLQAIVRRFS